MPGRESFPRQERLTRTSEYLNVYRHGTRYTGRAFICHVVREKGQGRKLGLAVSRKVGGAVVRNRIKRYIREIYRTRRRDLAKDCTVVIVARPHSAGMSFSECEAAIGRLLRQGEVLHG